MSDYLELKGKRALVTGGTKGIGEAVVAALREAGATVLTTARSRPGISPMRTSSSRPMSPPPKAAPWSPQAVRERLGGIDILVHVVGGSSAPAGGFAVLDDHEWHKALDQNLFAAVRLDRALLPAMIAQGSGVIIHITSIQRQLPLPDATLAYAAAKAALSNYSKGPVQGSEPQGRARRPRRRPAGSRRMARSASSRKSRARTSTDYEGARKIVMDSLGGIPIGRPAKPQGSRGPGRVPGLTTRRVHHRHGIRHRRRNRADGLGVRPSNGATDGTGRG